MWILPPGITDSTAGPLFAYCKLCQDHFSMADGGFNDVARHIQGKGHVKHFEDASGSRMLQSFLGQSSTSLSLKVMQACNELITLAWLYGNICQNLQNCSHPFRKLKVGDWQHCHMVSCYVTIQQATQFLSYKQLDKLLCFCWIA